MPTRVTGMYSGLDTESLISELVKAKKTKVTKYNAEKTKLEWKQEKWKDLNTKMKSLRATITSMQFSTDYVKKTTSVSNPNAVSVITGSGAMNAVQSLKIKELAQSGYLTGAEIQTTDKSAVKGSTKLSELGITDGGSFALTTNGKTTDIEVTGEMTVNDLVGKLKSAGVNANFDEKNSRLFIGATTSGTKADFSITANDAAGLKAMSKLGINAAVTDPEKDVNYAKYHSLADNLTELRNLGSGDAVINEGVDNPLFALLKEEAKDMEDPEEVEAAYQRLLSKAEMAQNVLNGEYDTYTNSKAVKLTGSDAKIELNGATFTSATNNIEVNGLTFTVMAKTADDETITVTTQDDTEGVYDMVKKFIKQYNDLVKEIDKLYNAEVNKLDPLTDEERDAISETEAEKLENKIKDSLLRKDSDLGNLFTTLKDTMAAGFKVGGKTMYLTDLGIGTLNYFDAADNEKALLHIDGDKDDADTSGNADKLKSMIATDSASVVSFFTGLMNKLSDELSTLSKSSSSRSYGSFYDDKKMKTDLSDWDSKIAEAEKKLNEYEDKWYSKFAKMETALSKMESKNSYLSGLFGTGK